jgi:diguanylate cyclase (GGDEF)-like protein
MEAIPALLVLLGLLLGLAAVGWWLAGTRLGLPRESALYWSAFSFFGLMAAVAGMLQKGPQLAWPIALADFALVAAFVSVSRGLALFVGKTPAWWPEVALLVGVTLLGLVNMGWGMDPYLRAMLGSAAVAVVLLRALWIGVRPAQIEFGRLVGLLVGGPILVTALLFASRVVTAAWRYPTEDKLLLSAPTAANGVGLIVLITLVALFNQALIFVSVARLTRRLHHLSRHDALTGLQNRRALLAALVAEQARVQRGSDGWALLLIDIDHFKRVNDQHGHAVGDQVLTRVANVLQQSSREVDVVARMGGEEFCVLAPMTPLHGAALLAERLRQAVEASAGEGEVSVTISVGISLAWVDAEDSADAAVARADVALYRAKAAGRNRVELPGEGQRVDGMLLHGLVARR